MKTIQEARSEINRIDAELAQLFEARMEAARVIAAEKKARGLSVRDPAREAEVIAHSRALIRDPEIEGYYVRFLQEVIDLSCRYQTRLLDGMRVTYCGVEGAYAAIAARKMFPGAQLVACADFTAAYQAVERGEADCAVLPLENSYAGEVGAVMDLMFSGSLYINQVLDLPIEHCLMACPGAAVDKVTSVVSHPQALEQCADYIRARGYETRACSNTALAAKEVAALDDPTVAAIASEETAALFGLRILERGINDSRNNTTRFAAFSPAANRPASAAAREDENFVLVFTVRNEAGALAQTLDIIGAHGYNLRALRSRPMKELQWNYYFYVEAEGDITGENGKNLLRELAPICAKLRLVGVYYVSGAQGA